MQEYTEDKYALELATKLVQFANENAGKAVSYLTGENFSNFLKIHPLDRGGYHHLDASIVTALIMEGSMKEACEICVRKLEGNVTGGTSSFDPRDLKDKKGNRPQRSFYEMALRYIYETEK